MTMKISLPPELEQIVTEKVASGRYPSAGDVIREALELLTARDALEEEHLDRLRE
jgi:antitoxin ParD1/3/4